jgi:hypothetical protein
MTPLAMPVTVEESRMRRPLDLFSTDGHILTRGGFEIELADEGAGKFGAYFDPGDPADEHYLTLNIYAVAPDHPNGCGRVLLPNATIITMAPARSSDDIVRRLVTLVANRLEAAGLSPYRDLVADRPDIREVLVEFAGLSPTLY